VIIPDPSASPSSFAIKRQINFYANQQHVVPPHVDCAPGREICPEPDTLSAFDKPGITEDGGEGYGRRLLLFAAAPHPHRGCPGGALRLAVIPPPFAARILSEAQEFHRKSITKLIDDSHGVHEISPVPWHIICENLPCFCSDNQDDIGLDLVLREFKDRRNAA
jgi:hypothetical protein